MDLDVYNILGVLQSATSDEIKKAYRKKALKCHPDKNPDNPEAAKLFHELSKALQLLLDESARAAYDRVLNAKTAAKLRTQALDSKRKKLKEDLEAREKEANLKGSGYKPYDSKTDEEKLQAEIKRLQEEGSKQLSEEIEYVRKQVEIETAGRKAEVFNDPSRYRLKIKWHVDKSDPENSYYNYDSLLKIFSKYGEISVLVMSKKKGSALLEFSNKNSAIKAEQFEKGLPSNPLKVSWLEVNPLLHSKETSKSTSANVSSNIFPSSNISDQSSQKVSFEKPLTKAPSLFPSTFSAHNQSNQKISFEKSSSNSPSLFPSMSATLNQRIFPIFPSQSTHNFKVKEEKDDAAITLVSDSDYETQVLQQLREAEKRKKLAESTAEDDVS